MIIQHFTDNDLYKFTTMNAIQKLYPKSKVRYEFFNRGGTEFPMGFAEELEKEIQLMVHLSLSKDEEEFIRQKCYYFDPVFIDFLKGYNYDPSEVSVTQSGGELKIVVEGYWYRTVLWEVPLMALVSELFFQLSGQKAMHVREKAIQKATAFKEMGAEYSEFGTRRRFSQDVHEAVLSELITHSGEYLKGTSNLNLAMKYNLVPIGTHPHEWFMYHAAQFGYRMANKKSLMNWTNVYHGDLGIALTDTFTTQNFFRSFDTEYAKLFDGVRWDSGDPFVFTDNIINFYKSKRIDPSSKTVVYSDSLNLDLVKEIKSYVKGRLHDVYGIGTYLTNDTGVKPLNIVIKMTAAKPDGANKYIDIIKLSDVDGKHTGNPHEIDLCKQLLDLA